MNGSLTENGCLTGRLSQDGSLFGTISEKMNLYGTLSHPSSPTVVYYNGEYVVDPNTKSKTVLGTKGKAMKDDVTVNKIQYIETSNLSGGTTVYIGEME